MSTFEVNFDGLVGPTHNYAGLSYGNIASGKNAGGVANPKAAALQGLAKMKALADMGLCQAILPPHERPHIPTLRQLGFSGHSEHAILSKAWREAPELAASCSSASSMWVANAATVSPKADTEDARTHFTPANLSSMFHRAIEAPLTSSILKAIFTDSQHFMHHAPLPAGKHFGDEGAANHTRFCHDYAVAGIELFVYGAYAFRSGYPHPQKFPARQSFEACQAIARRHTLNPNKTVYAQQNPAAIDAGVFHNDVVAVGNRNLFFFHEQAFLHKQQVLEELQLKFAPHELCLLEVSSQDIPVQLAVDSYLFNTQLVSINASEMAIIAPSECQENIQVNAYLEQLCRNKSNPIAQIHYFNLRESMRNGGGPACLRLRVVLDEADRQAIQARVFINDELWQTLNQWVDKHYRDRLSIDDLRDPALLDESRTALDELTRILHIGMVYDFQKP